MEFKDYKEKQKYYENRSKETKTIWDSTGVVNIGTKEKPKIKGRTYVKPKENRYDNNTK